MKATYDMDNLLEEIKKAKQSIRDNCKKNKIVGREEALKIVKQDIIDLLNEGFNPVDISKSFTIPKVSVRFIKNLQNEIKNGAAKILSPSPRKSKRSTSVLPDDDIKDKQNNQTSAEVDVKSNIKSVEVNSVINSSITQKGDEKINDLLPDIDLKDDNKSVQDVINTPIEAQVSHQKDTNSAHMLTIKDTFTVDNSIKNAQINVIAGNKKDVGNLTVKKKISVMEAD